MRADRHEPVDARKWDFSRGGLSTGEQILPVMVLGRTIQEQLDGLVDLIEAGCRGATASISLVSDDGKRLCLGSAPRLPEGLKRAMHGLRIGPSRGSCGTAAYRGERVVVVDTVEDPLWEKCLDLVERYKIRACWSQPIFSSDREVLGTIALFHSRPKQPTAAELQHLEAAGNLASIALRCDLAERQQRAADKRVLKQKATLVELATSELLKRIDLQAVFRRTAEAAARTLDVERVSVWLSDERFEVLHCKELYLLATHEHTNGAVLDAASCPRYFAALEKGRAIVAHQARTDPATREFTKTYLEPLGITSMLDAPLRSEGRLTGVVCHEHVGPVRRWTRDEQEFSASIGDFLSLVLAAHERQRAERTFCSSQQKRLQRRDRELHEARDEARRVFDSSIDLQCVAGPDGYFKRINPAFERVLGHSKEELLARPFVDFVHPDDQCATRQELEKLRKTLSTTAFENRYRCSDGSYRWLQWNAVQLPREGTVYAVARDITRQRRLAEEKLKLAEELKAINSALDEAAMVFTMDARGLILSANDRFCEASGYARQELLGENHRIVGSGCHTSQFFIDMWEELVAGKAWRGEICNQSKEGARYWVDTTIVPLRDDRGVPRTFVAIQIDISDRKRSEEMSTRLHNAVEQSTDSVFITDRHGVIEYVNPGFIATTGYSREEAMGRTPRILKSGRQCADYYRRVWKTILAGGTHRGELINRKKNGSLYYAEQTITPMRDSSGRVNHFVSVVKDMTNRRKIMRQESEMELARRVQQRLYVVEPHTIPGIDFAGAVFPAEATCGDYFDCINMPRERLGIAVGDVSGHGIAAALLMVEARAYLRSIAKTQSDVGQICTSLNDVLAKDTEDGRYVALILARLDPAARRLTYVNAGHTAGYILDRSGAVKHELASSGLPLGMFRGTRYSACRELTLEPGETVLFVTDGVTETEDRDARPLGSEGVIRGIKAYREESAERLLERVKGIARRFADGQAQADDMAVVICKLDFAV